MFRTRLCIGLAVTAMVLAVGSRGVAQAGEDVVQKAGNSGELNWSEEMLIARGIGGVNPDVPASAQRAGAIRAAKADAFRNLLEIIEGVNITSETTVENQITKSDVIRTKVEGIIQGAHVSKTRYMSDGSVEVEMSMPVVGELLDELLPEEPEGAPIVSEEEDTSAQGEEKRPTTPVAYTGLIVDARGLKLEPALAPKILDEAGREVYGVGFASKDLAVKKGLVAYEKDLSQAKKNELAGAKPLIVKALKASGTERTNVVIPTADALALHGSKANLSMLDQCRVIFVVD